MSEMCSECGASFGSPTDLLVHRRAAHQGGDPAATLRMNPASATPGVTCALCGRTFPSRQALARHNLLRRERPLRESRPGRPVPRW
jgi:hypothetical protein